MPVRSVWHTGFTVSDIERSVAFYRDAIGLRLRHRQEQANPYTATFVGYPGAHLKVAQFAVPDAETPLSGHVLELVEYVHPKGGRVPPGTNSVGDVHLALEVTGLDEIYEHALAAGANAVSEPQRITAGINAGGRTVYLRDPDGITVELVEAPPGAANPIRS